MQNHGLVVKRNKGNSQPTSIPTSAIRQDFVLQNTEIRAKSPHKVLRRVVAHTDTTQKREECRCPSYDLSNIRFESSGELMSNGLGEAQGTNQKA
jgi:hypothetical protein